MGWDEIKVDWDKNALDKAFGKGKAQMPSRQTLQQEREATVSQQVESERFFNEKTDESKPITPQERAQVDGKLKQLWKAIWEGSEWKP